MGKNQYTLWNKPRSEWTALPKMVITPDIERKIEEALNDPELQKKIEKRIKPYIGNTFFG